MREKLSITGIIKTFDRSACLESLLRSVKENRESMWLNFIIADDSKISSKAKMTMMFWDIVEEYIEMPYDSWISKWRQFALEKIKTKYFLLCDDDFIFSEKINFSYLLEILEKNKLDILAGTLNDKPEFLYRIGSFFSQIKKKNYENAFSILFKKKINRVFFGKIITWEFEYWKYKFEYWKYNKKISKNLLMVDYTSNFFIWRTDSIRKAGWWKNLGKIGNEHGLFFQRMKDNKLKVAILKEGFTAIHRQIFSVKYLLKRFRKYDNKKSEEDFKKIPNN